MSSPVVETVAWLALAAVAGLAAVVVVLLLRLEALSRAHTDRKWELSVLKAQIAELRRGQGAPAPDPAADGETDDPRPGRGSPAGPAAWRRGHGRAPARPPRRRRPG